MDTNLVTDVLKEALARYSTPQFLNCDQGSQYTSKEHIQILKGYGITVSMNGTGRSIDNIAIEDSFAHSNMRRFISRNTKMSKSSKEESKTSSTITIPRGFIPHWDTKSL